MTSTTLDTTLYSPFEDQALALTDAERAFAFSVREWVDRRVRPEAVAAWEAGTLPRTWLEEMKQMGWFALTTSKAYGGTEQSYRHYALLCSELERADSGLRSVLSVHCSLAMQAIARFGSEEQKQHYLPKMVTGELLGCFALTEPEAGSDPSSMATVAVKNDSGYLINGTKRWCTSATIADVCVAFVNSEQGIRGFILERGDAGFTPRSLQQKGSLRISESAEVLFTDCQVADTRLLPGTEKGIGAALSCLSMARSGIIWGALGAARHCYNLALAYTAKRNQFGRPLAATQLVQEKLVDSYAALVQAQLLADQVVAQITAAKQKGELTLKDIRALTPLISLGKRTSCRVARQVLADCRDLLGANGILLEHEVIRHMANLESIYTYEGTDHIHTLIVGQSLTGHAAF